MAVTAAAVAGVQQETGEMVGMLVQKVAAAQHSVMVYCVEVWRTVADLQQFAVVMCYYC